MKARIEERLKGDVVYITLSDGNEYRISECPINGKIVINKYTILDPKISVSPRYSNEIELI